MVIASKQTIQVITEFITKGAERARRNAVNFNKGMDAQGEKMASMNAKQKRFTENIQSNKVAQQGFISTLRMGQPELKRFNEQGRKFTTIGGAMANRVRLATHGLRGFRMEMLGVMFFGMAMQRVFAGLLKTSLTWVGVNEILTAALGILFLPVAMMILDWAIEFMGWVSQLTEGQKKWIGVVVLMGIAFGAFLFIVGTLALGIGSLILVFGALSAPLLIIGAALAAIAALVLGGALFDKLTKGTEDLGLVTQGISFDGILEKLKIGLQKAIDYLTENLPIWVDKGLKLASALLEGIAEKSEEITQVLSDLVEIMIVWVGENTGKIFAIGWLIAKGIRNGIAAGIGILGETLRQKFLDKLNIEEDGLIDKFLFGPINSPPSPSPTVASFGQSTAFPTSEVGNVSIVNNNNVTVSDKSEFETMLNEYSRNQDDEIKRIFKII